MAELFSFVIGWAIKKSLDLLWGSLVWLTKWARPKFDFSLISKKRLIELEHKARCLETLTKAYDQLPPQNEPMVKAGKGAPQWRQ